MTSKSNSGSGWSSICSYGCFFGKSQPSIAHRVLESKAKRLQLMNSSKAANRSDHNHMLVVVRRPKAHELKASRDYSSILPSVSDGLTKKPNPLDEFQGKGCGLGRTKLLMPRNKVPDRHIKMPPKLVKSTATSKSDQITPVSTSCSRSLIAKTIKRKSEEKIDDSVQLKKAKVTQNRLQYSDHVHKAAASLSKQGKQLQEPNKAKAKANVNHVVPRKVLQPSSQNKNKELNEAATKAASLSKLNKRKPPPTKQHMGPKQKLADKAKSFSSTHEVDTSYISSLCQNLFRRNHHKNQVHDDDDDDDCMVSCFSDILKEERRSEQLARKEDQIELLRLQREERDEKLGRQAKKQQKLY